MIIEELGARAQFCGFKIPRGTLKCNLGMTMRSTRGLKILAMIRHDLQRNGNIRRIFMTT